MSATAKGARTRSARKARGGILCILASAENMGRVSKKEAAYLFKYLLMANMCMYLEAGAVPALLIRVAEAFNMPSGQQGLLGGIVYLSLALGGPFAGYLLKACNPKAVICVTVCMNNLLTFLWALTPTGLSYSTQLFIAIRFCMGLTQCVVCVFLPLWTNQFAPAAKRTRWMSYLQGSVPLAVMLGYIIASVTEWIAVGAGIELPLQDWRWPFLVEAVLFFPFCVAVFFVPEDHLKIYVDKAPSKACSKAKANAPRSYGAISEPTNPLLNGNWPSRSAIPKASLEASESSGSEPLPFEEDERIRKFRLRPLSMTASFYSAMSAPNAMQRSYDDLASLDTTRDIVSLFRREPSGDDEVRRPAGHASTLEPPARAHSGEDTPADLAFERAKLADVAARFAERVVVVDGNSSDDLTRIHSQSPSVQESTETDTEADEEETTSHGASILVLLRTPVFLCLVFAMCALYYVVTGVQYWGTSYFVIALHGSQYATNSCFVVVAATGPTLGVLFGGWLIDSQGGYKGLHQRVKTLRVCLSLGVLACVFATPITFLDSFALNVVLLWAVLFFGAAVLPACSGMILSTVPARHRPASSAFSLVTFNLFGYCLSLVLSGYLMELFNKLPGCDPACSRKLGFRVVLLWSYWAFVFMVLALVFAIRAEQRRINRYVHRHSMQRSAFAEKPGLEITDRRSYVALRTSDPDGPLSNGHTTAV